MRYNLNVTLTTAVLAALRVQHAGIPWKAWMLYGAVCLGIKLTLRLDPFAYPYPSRGPALNHDCHRISTAIIPYCSKNYYYNSD